MQLSRGLPAHNIKFVDPNPALHQRPTCGVSPAVCLTRRTCVLGKAEGYGTCLPRRYNLDSLLLKYQGVDWRTAGPQWQCNRGCDLVSVSMIGSST